MSESQPETATITDIPQRKSTQYERKLSISQRIENRTKKSKSLSTPPTPQKIVVKLPPIESNIDIYALLPENCAKFTKTTEEWIHSTLKKFNFQSKKESTSNKTFP
eukprot:354921_1